MKRKAYWAKRAAYLKKRAAKFSGHAAPISVPPVRLNRPQPLIHNGQVTSAQMRAIAAVTGDQL